MRFWRSIGLLVLALGILAGPAHSADKKKKEKAPKPVAVAKVTKSKTKSSPPKVTKSKTKSSPPKVAKSKKVKSAPVLAAVDSTRAKKPKKARVVTNHVPERRAWMMGLGGGWSTVGFRGIGLNSFAPHPVVTLAPGATFRVYPQPVFGSSNNDNGITRQFTVAYALRPTLAVGFRRLSWSNGASQYNKWTVGVSAMTATWYPGGGYWYFRVGGGPADVTGEPGYVRIYTLTSPDPTVGSPFAAPAVITTASDRTRYADYGFGGLVSVGMDWKLFSRISVSPELHAAQATFNRATASGILGGGVSIDWWF